jgi:phytoene synthase
MLHKNEPPNFQREILKIVKNSGTSFYWAIRFLPKKKREAMFAVYAFCREVDDIADGDKSSIDKMIQLNDWRTKIDKLYSHNPDNVITHALIEPVKTFKLNKTDFIAIIDGMETDAVEQLRIQDLLALSKYCDQVACAVGRLSNNIFGVEPAIGNKLAKSLGEALQLTNILRDIHEDGDRNRVYVPRDILSNYGNDRTLINEILEHPGFTNACNDLAKLNIERFTQAEAIIKKCDTKLVRPAMIMMKIYYQLFILLERRGWERYKIPVKVSKIFKLWIFARVLILKK